MGEGIVVFNNGVFSKKSYIFKLGEIKGISVTDRFFETKTTYASFEVFVDGYSGIYILGFYDRSLEQKIVEKIKDN